MTPTNVEAQLVDMVDAPELIFIAAFGHVLQAYQIPRSTRPVTISILILFIIIICIPDTIYPLMV